MRTTLHRSLAAIAAGILACAGVVAVAAPASAADTDLGVTYTIAPSQITVDQSAQYRVIVSNSGTQISGYSLTITHSGPVDSLVGPTGCTTLGSSITCVGSLFPGGSSARTFDLTPSGTGVVTSTAVVTTTGSQSDPNPANNTASAQTTVVGTGADIAVGLDANANALLGSRITYDLTAANQGPGGADSATVVVDLPTQVTGVTGLATGCSYNPATDHVTCATGAIAAGAEFDETFQANLGLLSTGPLPATATRTASSPADPNAANDSASATCTVLTSLVIVCT